MWVDAFAFSLRASVSSSVKWVSNPPLEKVAVHGFGGIPNPKKGSREQTEIKQSHCLPLSNYNLKKEINQLLYRLLAEDTLCGGGEELIFRVMKSWVLLRHALAV